MISFSRITSPSHPHFNSAIELYTESFPLHEQRRSVSQQNILSHPLYHCDAVLADGSFCGILFSWGINDITYIEHFAISHPFRGQGIGSAVLKEFLRTHPLTVLEIDPPVDEISRRRERFYQTLGFVSNAFAHHHPSYHRQFTAHELVVLSYPRKLSADEYRAFYAFLVCEVMKDAL